MWWVARRRALESFMLPVAAAGEQLLCADGSLVSLIRIEGARSIAGPAEVARFVEVAARGLNSQFTERGHALHFVFDRAPDEAALALERVCARQRERGERVGLAMDDVLAERERRLAPLLAAESLVVACWTRRSAITDFEAKRDVSRSRLRREAWFPKLAESQCPAMEFDSLEARHEALLDALVGLCTDAGVVTTRLNAERAVAVMRRAVNGPATTGGDWRPVTVSNDAPARVEEPAELGAYPPALAPQILVREPVRVGAGLAIGERLWGGLDMCLGPRQVRPFSELMDRLAGAGLPFRLSVLIEGGGLRYPGAGVARVASSFLAVSSVDSRAVRDAMREVAALDADAQAVVRLRLSVLTWVAPEDGEEALGRRLSRLQQFAEGWGEPVFSPLVGDLLETFAGSIAGFCCGGTAPAAYAPLRDALALLPVSRPAPLGEDSSGHIFRSPDGKMLPLGLDEGQDHVFELIYGVPGRGKSVLLNSLGLAFALQGGQARLPLMATIDIGPSSSGLISLLREALPYDRRGEVGWFRLRMSSECTINPCDTLLGCRYPLAADRAFLSNLLGLMLTPAGVDGVPDGMRELIGPTIDGAYAMRSDFVAGAEPSAYSAGRDQVVDEALAAHGVHLPDGPLWWDVVDGLFEAGAVEAAVRGQRFAVPRLGDLLSAVREPSVQGLVGDARYGSGGESVTDAFRRILTSLSGTWPIMFGPTTFDVGNARIAAVDLAEVAPGGSAEADRQTSAFYMLVRQALTRTWWIAPEDMRAVPERYRAWHTERAQQLREAPKRLAYDEFHRTSSAAPIRAQVERDVREARKMRVGVALSSQRLDDFGGALVELANRYWVLGAGGKVGEIEALSTVFELSETALDAVRYRLTGPGRDGAPALLIANGARGRAEQLVVNTPGAVELWALSTSPGDVALRGRVLERLGPAAGRAALAARFPSGSARETVLSAVRAVEARGGGSAGAEDEVLDRLAAEVVAAAADS